jgi:TRAP-type C4-dicarboxylate transport system permease small subunit
MNKIIYGLSRAMAWLGAVVLTLIALMSVVSIIGRALSGFGLGPVPGDFELVEAGTALAVFCFLPWCHLKGGHAMVDMFWSSYPPAVRRVLMVLSDALMFIVWALLVWRMSVAMGEYRHNNEVSFILQMPVWWGYAASFPAAVIGVVAYAWRLLESLGLASPPQGFVMAGGGH